MGEVPNQGSQWAEKWSHQFKPDKLCIFVQQPACPTVVREG